MKGTQMKTRKPTGKPPWPMILLAGEEKAGKSYAIAEFSASKKIGRMFWLDLGEGAADEYSVLPGADYEVIVHDGSYQEILHAVEEVSRIAHAAARKGEPPVVLAIDSISTLWKSLSMWAANRAANLKMNRENMRRDIPPTVPAFFWTDANKRHQLIVDHLISMPAIVIATAKLKEITAVTASGELTSDTVWKPETQKDLPSAATVLLHMFRQDRRVELVGARSLLIDQRDGKPIQLENFSLEKLVFELLGCDKNTTGRDVAPMTEGTLDKARVEVDEAQSTEDLRKLWKKYQKLLRGDDWAIFGNISADRAQELEAEKKENTRGEGDGKAA